jgi:hypothetical protein
MTTFVKGKKMGGWIGVDLDGTLAKYTGWQGVEHIGEPIMPMVERVKKWVKDGVEVRIFTARVTVNPNRPRDVELTKKVIEAWCKEHIGTVLPVTNVKDFGLVELWDDRAVRVVANAGNPCCSNVRTL